MQSLFYYEEIVLQKNSIFNSDQYSCFPYYARIVNSFGKGLLENEWGTSSYD